VRTFLSPDTTTAVTIEDAPYRAILEQCVASGQTETGGILIGRYNDWRDRAIVVEATGPPRDSRRFRLAFWRGFGGLSRLLENRWKTSQTYYLGEWHFHPLILARPSQTDLDQMRAFAIDPAYRCPRPVLIVIGGDPGNPEVEVAVIDGAEVVRLTPSVI
jgi:integrative and conjugative element protein (TIGR02256 family)